MEVSHAQLHFGTTAPFRVGASIPLLWGYGGILGLTYVVSPRLSRYSTGLSAPSEILILYQRMYESTASMNWSVLPACQSRG